MKLLKDKIRNHLKSKIDVKFRIVTKSPSLEDMNKKLFVEALTALKEIEDRRDFLADEIGMDMTQYEDKFFIVIENLVKLTFNKHQQALIHIYLYTLTPDPDWDGMVTVEVGKQEKTFPFKTPEEVWDVLQKVSKK